MNKYMNKITRAQEIYAERGLFSLLSSLINFITYRIARKKAEIEDKIKTLRFFNDTTKIGEINVSLDSSVFSAEMRMQIRNFGYESSERDLITKYIQNNQPTIDLGAGIGYTSCIIGMETDESSSTVAVEANESLIPVIQDTKNRNNCDFEVLHSAYHPEKEYIKFQLANDFWSSSQYKRTDSEQAEVTVPAVSVEQIIKRYELNDPIQLVCDIEGGEHNLIIDERDILKKFSTIIFEYHSFTDRKFEHYDNILTESGFEFIESQGSVYVYSKYDHALL